MPASNSNPIQKARPNVPKRNRNSMINQPELNTPILITNAAAAGTVLTLTFDRQIVLQSTPEITTDVAGAVPVSAAKTSPNVVAITFDNDISAATSLNIPFRGGAIRNSSGGYVTSNTFPVAA